MANLTRSALLAGTAAAIFVPNIVRAQTPEKIQFAGVPTDDMTPIYYAIKTGMYEKAGLDDGDRADGERHDRDDGRRRRNLPDREGQPDRIAGRALAGSAADGDRERLDLGSRQVLFNEAVVAADSNIKTGADLNGKTAATPALNDLNQLVISAWVDKNGGDSKTMKWIEFPNSALGAALADHRIDVCALQEPQLSAELAGGKVRALAPVYNAVSEHFCFADYFANKPWADKNADAVKRWVKATFDAAVYTNGHHAETVALMSDVTKIPPAIYAKMARVQGATQATSDPALMQPLIDTAAKYKMIPRVFPAKDLMFTG